MPWPDPEPIIYEDDWSYWLNEFTVLESMKGGEKKEDSDKMNETDPTDPTDWTQ